METNILEKLGLPDDQEAIFGRQEQAKDEAIRYAISGLLDAKEKMEKQFGNYATMNAMVWLVDELTDKLLDGPSLKIKRD
tara:strand:- start:214 stop:453 length:240 start_codon:yes stop_codon:yes gene_type:complete